MDSRRLKKTVSFIAQYYNGCKVGYEGCQGYRKSTDLVKLGKCIEQLLTLRYIDPRCAIFTDLGCGDGRVNVLISYFVKKSIGIEIDPEILAEYGQHIKDLTVRLKRANLVLPPDNIVLFQGNSLEAATYERIAASSGVRFNEIDLFYTYITLHDLFAEKVAKEANRGALYLVYGFSKVLPRYRGLELLIPDVASQGIMALYGKGEF